MKFGYFFNGIIINKTYEYGKIYGKSAIGAGTIARNCNGTSESIR
jgi:hypothetical protein